MKACCFGFMGLELSVCIRTDVQKSHVLEFRHDAIAMVCLSLDYSGSKTRLTEAVRAQVFIS